MNRKEIQRDFFSEIDLPCNNEFKKELSLTKEILENWQLSIQNYQSNLFKDEYNEESQYSLFEE